MYSSFTRWQFSRCKDAIWPIGSVGETSRLWDFIGHSVPFPSVLHCVLWLQVGPYLERKANSVGKRRCCLPRCYCSALWTYQGKIQHLLCWGNPFYSQHYLRREGKTAQHIPWRYRHYMEFSYYISWIKVAGAHYFLKWRVEVGKVGIRGTPVIVSTIKIK